MGWNDHHPGIAPDDPDPGETLREQADAFRQRIKDGEEVADCRRCGGSGEGRTVVDANNPSQEASLICPKCHGSGRMLAECPTCRSPVEFTRRMVGYHFPHAEPCKDTWHE